MSRSLEDLRSVSRSSRNISNQKADNKNAAWNKLIGDILGDSTAAGSSKTLVGIGGTTPEDPVYDGKIGSSGSKESQSLKSDIPLVEHKRVYDSLESKQVSSPESEFVGAGDDGNISHNSSSKLEVHSGESELLLDSRAISVDVGVAGGKTSSEEVEDRLRVVGYAMTHGSETLNELQREMDTEAEPMELLKGATVDVEDELETPRTRDGEGGKDDISVNSFGGESVEDQTENLQEDSPKTPCGIKEELSEITEQLNDGGYQMESKYHSEAATGSSKRETKSRRTVRRSKRRQPARRTPKNKGSWWHIDESKLDSSDEVVMQSGGTKNGSSDPNADYIGDMMDSENVLSLGGTELDFNATNDGGDILRNASDASLTLDDGEMSNEELIAFIRGDDSNDFNLDGSNHSSMELLGSMLPTRSKSTDNDEENDTSFCDSMNSSIENLMTNLLPKRKVPFDRSHVVPTPIHVIRNLIDILPKRASNAITITFKDSQLDESGENDVAVNDDIEDVPVDGSQVSVPDPSNRIPLPGDSTPLQESAAVEQ